MRIISDKIVKTRKEHNCWGCTRKQPTLSELQAVVCEDIGKIYMVYWCNTCRKYMDDHLDFWERQQGFGFGELREYEDYPEEE